MCGILGVFNHGSENCPVTPELLARLEGRQIQALPPTEVLRLP